MPNFTTNDGVTLAYEDWGHGKPVLFVHSWALDSQMWAPHMLHFNALGMRTIAMDRRGHGRSERPYGGYDYDRLADDLAALIEHLDLRELTLIGHSMGTGECVRLLSRHGSERIAKVILLSPVAPCYLDADGLPLPASTVDAALAAIHADFPQWLAEGADGFYLPAETHTSEGVIRRTIDIMLGTSLHAATECFRTRVGADLRDELRQIDVPMLVIHGERDVSELVAFGRAIAGMVPACRYLEYADAPHGMFHTHQRPLLKDMQDFIGANAHA
ncbi:alpha/beta fold hydrolase [Dyella japonica]|uniref:Alpha/beta hydrolase n=1 Tax=Dyella japonica A8 TaxID=1217721 RepID=A0A075K031_9GAMM|nr:alpha/beta hydrolase [Dyella japonica]AIF47127.1 alpha/beta hydrolase [Dyella japonica A8]